MTNVLSISKHKKSKELEEKGIIQEWFSWYSDHPLVVGDGFEEMEGDAESIYEYLLKHKEAILKMLS